MERRGFSEVNRLRVRLVPPQTRPAASCRESNAKIESSQADRYPLSYTVVQGRASPFTRVQAERGGPDGTPAKSWRGILLLPTLHYSGGMTIAHSRVRANRPPPNPRRGAVGIRWRFCPVWPRRGPAATGRRCAAEFSALEPSGTNKKAVPWTRAPASIRAGGKGTPATLFRRAAGPQRRKILRFYPGSGSLAASRNLPPYAGRTGRGDRT